MITRIKFQYVRIFLWNDSRLTKICSLLKNQLIVCIKHYGAIERFMLLFLLLSTLHSVFSNYNLAFVIFMTLSRISYYILSVCTQDLQLYYQSYTSSPNLILLYSHQIRFVKVSYHKSSSQLSTQFVIMHGKLILIKL